MNRRAQYSLLYEVVGLIIFATVTLIWFGGIESILGGLTEDNAITSFNTLTSAIRDQCIGLGAPGRDQGGVTLTGLDIKAPSSTFIISQLTIPEELSDDPLTMGFVQPQMRKCVGANCLCLLQLNEREGNWQMCMTSDFDSSNLYFGNDLGPPGCPFWYYAPPNIVDQAIQSMMDLLQLQVFDLLIAAIWTMDPDEHYVFPTPELFGGCSYATKENLKISNFDHTEYHIDCSVLAGVGATPYYLKDYFVDPKDTTLASFMGNVNGNFFTVTLGQQHLSTLIQDSLVDSFVSKVPDKINNKFVNSMGSVIEDDYSQTILDKISDGVTTDFNLDLSTGLAAIIDSVLNNFDPVKTLAQPDIDECVNSMINSLDNSLPTVYHEVNIDTPTIGLDSVALSEGAKGKVSFQLDKLPENLDEVSLLLLTKGSREVTCPTGVQYGPEGIICPSGYLCLDENGVIGCYNASIIPSIKVDAGTCSETVIVDDVSLEEYAFDFEPICFQEGNNEIEFYESHNNDLYEIEVATTTQDNPDYSSSIYDPFFESWNPSDEWLINVTIDETIVNDQLLNYAFNKLVTDTIYRSFNQVCDYSYPDPVAIGFQSYGADQGIGSYVHLFVGDDDLALGDRGINLVVLNADGTVVESKSFEMYVWDDTETPNVNEIDAGCPTLSTNLGTYLNSLTPGQIVMMGVRDDASVCMSYGTAKAAIQALGSELINNLGYADSWGMIAVVGDGMKVEDLKDGAPAVGSANSNFCLSPDSYTSDVYGALSNLDFTNLLTTSKNTFTTYYNSYFSTLLDTQIFRKNFNPCVSGATGCVRVTGTAPNFVETGEYCSDVGGTCKKVSCEEAFDVEGSIMSSLQTVRDELIEDAGNSFEFIVAGLTGLDVTFPEVTDFNTVYDFSGSIPGFSEALAQEQLPYLRNTLVQCLSAKLAIDNNSVLAALNPVENVLKTSYQAPLEAYLTNTNQELSDSFNAINTQYQSNLRTLMPDEFVFHDDFSDLIEETGEYVSQQLVSYHFSNVNSQVGVVSEEIDDAIEARLTTAYTACAAGDYPCTSGTCQTGPKAGDGCSNDIDCCPPPPEVDCWPKTTGGYFKSYPYVNDLLAWRKYTSVSRIQPMLAGFAVQGVGQVANWAVGKISQYFVSRTLRSAQQQYTRAMAAGESGGGLYFDSESFRVNADAGKAQTIRDLNTQRLTKMEDLDSIGSTSAGLDPDVWDVEELSTYGDVFNFMKDNGYTLDSTNPELMFLADLDPKPLQQMFSIDSDIDLITRHLSNVRYRSPTGGFFMMPQGTSNTVLSSVTGNFFKHVARRVLGIAADTAIDKSIEEIIKQTARKLFLQTMATLVVQTAINFGINFWKQTIITSLSAEEVIYADGGIRTFDPQIVNVRSCVRMDELGCNPTDAVWVNESVYCQTDLYVRRIANPNTWINYLKGNDKCANTIVEGESCRDATPEGYLECERDTFSACYKLSCKVPTNINDRYHVFQYWVGSSGDPSNMMGTGFGTMQGLRVYNATHSEQQWHHQIMLEVIGVNETAAIPSTVV